MSRILLVSISVLALAGCATAIDGAQQHITFETKGASEARCLVDTGDNLYQVYPPQTVRIKKTRKPMVIDCSAPGNRRKTVQVESSLSARSVAGGPGVLWDAESGAMYHYPDHIVINFQDLQASMSTLPVYHNLDGIDPNRGAAGITNMGPTTPALREDAEMDVKRAAAWDEYNKQQAWEAERESRMEAADPGVKK